jgi:hypothetical protein
LLQIPRGMVIPGLRDLLVKVVGDYALQIQLQNGCRLVTVEDVVDLMRGMLARANCGTRIDASCVCAICRWAGRFRNLLHFKTSSIRKISQFRVHLLKRL